MGGHLRMSILAHVVKINMSRNKYIYVNKLKVPPLTPFNCTFLLHSTEDKRKPYRLKMETKRFLDSGCSGKITNEG